MTGLCKINNTDIYTEYGVFLAETSAPDTSNMNELLRVPGAKDITTVDFRERNGVELPSDVNLKLESIERTLQFCLSANSDAERLQKYQQFIKLLCSGKLTFDIAQYGQYVMVYQDMPSSPQWYKTFSGKSIAIFKVKFLEPQPSLGVV